MVRELFDVDVMRPSVVAGLVGRGIAASLTPAMHEREGAAQGLRYVYRRFDLDVLGLEPEALPDLLRAAEWLGLAGLNVTFPLKQRIIAQLDELAPEAAALGAVNTVVFDAGRRIGHNTDAPGFAEAFRRGLAGAPRDVVVLLGCGGGGSAVAHALLGEGVGELVLIDAQAERAMALAQSLGARFGAGRARVATDAAGPLGAAHGLINATPVGMDKYPGLPLSAELLRPDMWVADIVYFPYETALLASARARGCRTLDGGGMAVWQAVRAFELFTGIAPDAGRMAAHFRRLVDRRP